MTGRKGNSDFCFPEALHVPRGEAEGNIEVEGKQNSLFPVGPVIRYFGIPPNSQREKNCEELVCLTSAGSQICRGVKEHDLITCESKVQVAVSLLRESVSFVRPRMLVSFDPPHVTRSSPIEKRISVGRYNN